MTPPRPPAGGLATLLLLADGRLPAGGHAHSGGAEPAVADGRIASVDDLRRYLEGRVATTGRVDAALAVAARSWAAAAGAPTAAPAATSPLAGAPTPAAAAYDDLDAEVAARLPAPALRAASRAQGRGLLRAARRCWASPALAHLAAGRADGPYHVLALGAAADAAGVDDRGVATAALWSAVGAPAWAAVRLLGLDPLAVTAVLAALAPVLDAEAATAAAGVDDPARWPAAGAPLGEIGAETHAAWEVRLFAS